MADALVLGASTSVCGFKSHLPHQVKSYILISQNVAFSYIFKQKGALHAILLAWRNFYDTKNDSLKVNDSALSIFLAMAQEESCSKSENIKFGIRARMRSGKTILNHSQFLGYTKGSDGVLVIVPEEAEIVRKIFDLYL